MSQEFRLNLQEKRKQAFGFAAGAIRDRLKEGQPSVIALSSSGTPRRAQGTVTEQLALRLGNEKKCLLVRLDLGGDGQSSGWKTEENQVAGRNIPLEQVRQLLEQKGAEYDVILLDIPPVMLFSDALEYARLADQLYLVERYRFTLYSRYEKTMALLRDAGIPAGGVIACR